MMVKLKPGCNIPVVSIESAEDRADFGRSGDPRTHSPCSSPRRHSYSLLRRSCSRGLQPRAASCKRTRLRGLQRHRRHSCLGDDPAAVNQRLPDALMLPSVATDSARLHSTACYIHHSEMSKMFCRRKSCRSCSHPCCRGPSGGDLPWHLVRRGRCETSMGPLLGPLPQLRPQQKGQTSTWGQFHQRFRSSFYE